MLANEIYKQGELYKKYKAMREQAMEMQKAAEATYYGSKAEYDAIQDEAKKEAFYIQTADALGKASKQASDKRHVAEQALTLIKENVKALYRRSFAVYFRSTESAKKLEGVPVRYKKFQKFIENFLLDAKVDTYAYRFTIDIKDDALGELEIELPQFNGGGCGEVKFTLTHTEFYSGYEYISHEKIEEYLQKRSEVASKISAMVDNLHKAYDNFRQEFAEGTHYALQVSFKEEL